MVTTLAAQAPVTPFGRPMNVAPVAPVVVYVIFVIAVLAHTVCASVPTAELSVMVLTALDTVIVPVVLTVPQPPVRLTV